MVSNAQDEMSLAGRATKEQREEEAVVELEGRVGRVGKRGERVEMG